MKPSKTSIAILGFGFLLAAACTTVGCSQNVDDSTSSTTSSSSQALSEATSSHALNAEPNATAADYHVSTKTFRLFGTQENAEGGGFATIADKANWSTKNIAVGDWLARNIQVAAIHSDSIDLLTSHGTITVERGKDFQEHALYHRFDTAAVYEGKSVWRVDGKVMTDLHHAYGAGATGEERSGIAPASTNLGEQRSVVLTSVDRRGVLAHLGFAEHSVLLAMNGVALHRGDLEQVATALTKSGTSVTLTVADHGAQHTIAIEVD